jgi:hypothetical protein
MAFTDIGSGSLATADAITLKSASTIAEIRTRTLLTGFKYKYGFFDVVRFFVPFMTRGVLRKMQDFLQHLRQSHPPGTANINIRAPSVTGHRIPAGAL